MSKKIKCPLCNSKRFRLLYDLSSKSFEIYKIVKCKTCDLVFRNPQPAEQEINKFYTKEYYLGTTDYTYRDERNDQRLLIKYSEKVESFRKIKKGGRLLDIGCAFGMFLKAASKYYNCYGVEISQYASDYAKAQGLNVFNGTVERARYPDNYFDIVNMVEIIEHLSDPKQTLSEIHRILKPDGILIIKTSNIESLYAKSKGGDWDYILPGHLCYFSIKTLSKILALVGFQTINITKKMNVKELIKNFGIQSYIMPLLLKLNQVYLANLLIRGMTFFAKKR